MAAPRLQLRDILPLALTRPQRVLATAAQAVKAEWWKLAGERLNTSGRSVSAYRAGLSIDRGTAGRVRIVLSGLMPNIFEQGMGPGGVGTQGAYDQRIFSLKETTRNIRHRKDGRLYLMVPFGMKMKDIVAVGGFAAGQAARALAPTLTHRVAGEERTQSWGDHLGPGHAPNARPSTRYVHGRMFAPHETDPLAGLVRKQSSYSQAEVAGGRRPQATYMKWRVMSQAGKPWMNPGVLARALAEDVQMRMGALLGRLFGGG